MQQRSIVLINWKQIFLAKNLFIIVSWFIVEFSVFVVICSGDWWEIDLHFYWFEVLFLLVVLMMLLLLLLGFLLPTLVLLATLFSLEVFFVLVAVPVLLRPVLWWSPFFTLW